MSYVEHGLDLSPLQQKKISRGEKVRISHKSLNGSHPMYLTKSQYNKIKKALEQGKGVDLVFSQRQVKHHVGKGIFSDAKNFLIGKARDVYDVARDRAEDLYDDNKGRAKELLRSGIDYGVNRAKDRLDKELEKRGFGFYEDLRDQAMKVAREQGQNLLRQGIDAGVSKGSDLLNSQLKKRLGLGRKKKEGGSLSGMLGMLGLGMGDKITDRRYREKFITPVENQIADQQIAHQVQQGQKGNGFWASALAPVAVNMAMKQLGMGKKKKKEVEGGFIIPALMAKKILGLGKKKKVKGEGFFNDVLGFAGDTAKMGRDLAFNVGAQALTNKLSGRGRKSKSGGSFSVQK